MLQNGAREKLRNAGSEDEWAQLWNNYSEIGKSNGEELNKLIAKVQTYRVSSLRPQ